MRGLSQAGVMRASAAELDAAATNVLVLATFWLNYAAVRGDKDENAAIRDGIVQVMMLLAPFLRDAERVHLNNLKPAYIRTEERRVGKEGGMTFKHRWATE